MRMQRLAVIKPILVLLILIVTLVIRNCESKGGGGGSRSSSGYSSSYSSRESSSSSRGRSGSGRGSSYGSSRSYGSSSYGDRRSSSIWKSKGSGRTKHYNSYSSISRDTGYYSSAVHPGAHTWGQSVSKGVNGGGFLLPKRTKENYVGGLDRGIGGGGWVAPKSYKSAKQFSFDNSFGRYGGGKGMFGEHLGSRNMNLFKESGSKSFSISNGAGFAGRTHPGLASMESWHRYKQYKAMMKYKMDGKCFHGYCGRGYYHRRHCYGGCYGSSFCDFGVCRCHNGYYPYRGSCYDNTMSLEDEEQVIEATKSKLDLNPFQACNDTSDCHSIDMNLICSTESKTCKCREDMKWNEEDHECQVFIDVDCQIFETYGDPDEVSTSDSNLNPKWGDCKDDAKGAIQAGYTYTFASRFEKNPKCVYIPDSYDNEAYNEKTYEYFHCYTDGYRKYCPKTCGACGEKWEAEYGGLDISNVQLPSYNLTETKKGFFDLNITDIGPEETMSTSYLTKLDLKKAKPMDLKKEFCIELNAISTKYSEPERVRQYVSNVSIYY